MSHPEVTYSFPSDVYRWGRRSDLHCPKGITFSTPGTLVYMYLPIPAPLAETFTPSESVLVRARGSFRSLLPRTQGPGVDFPSVMLFRAEAGLQHVIINCWSMTAMHPASHNDQCGCCKRNIQRLAADAHDLRRGNTRELKSWGLLSLTTLHSAF